MPKHTANYGPHRDRLVEFLSDPGRFVSMYSTPTFHHDVEEGCGPLEWKTRLLRRNLTLAMLDNGQLRKDCPCITKKGPRLWVVKPRRWTGPASSCECECDMMDNEGCSCLSIHDISMVPDAYAICANCKTLFCVEVENQNRIGDVARSRYTAAFWGLDEHYWAIALNVVDFRGGITPLYVGFGECVPFTDAKVFGGRATEPEIRASIIKASLNRTDGFCKESLT